MGKTPHLLITGDPGVGKSTLINLILERSGLPVYGFVTRKEAKGEDGSRPFYMFDASRPVEGQDKSRRNLLGYRRLGKGEIYSCVFDTLGVELIRSAKPDGVLRMDELGFMESDSPKFTAAVLEALRGDIPVIVSAKNKPGVPFLEAVFACPGVRIIRVTKENRQELCETLPGTWPN